MNILVLTTIYQEPDDAIDSATTPVVHNFAKEWVKQGHKVIVIHNSNMFLWIVYHVPGMFKRIASKKFGFRASLNPCQRKELKYVKDGVLIYREPLLKVIPMGSYSKRVLNKQQTTINRILRDNSFTPDVIVGHAENPQIFQIYHLNKIFPAAKTGIVFHGIEYLNRPSFTEWRDVYLPSIRRYGFRSKNLHRKAEREIDFKESYFMCPSGIDSSVIMEDIQIKHSKIRNLIYVGQLIERKHLKTIIEAINMRPERDYCLTVIGDGESREEYEKFAAGKKAQVIFLGKQPHNRVIEEMRKSDCFIMVSENEVFGLVYLEAMAQGCVTVAAKNEGMEGIIENGINGFLSDAGNVDGLVDILDRLESMSYEEIYRVQKKGLELAKEYADSIVAEKYLNNVLR